MQRCFLILLFFLGLVRGQDPQFKTLATLELISEIKDLLVPVIEPIIENTRIPDVSGSTGTPIGITINYDITDIIISQFQLGPSSVSLDSSGVQISLSSVEAVLNMNWGYSALFIRGSGSATDTLGLSVQTLLILGEVSGKPTIQVGSLSIDITSIDIQLHGGASWFYQVFVDIFKGQIQGIFQNTLQGQLVSVIDQLANYYLKNTPTQYQITPYLVLDYSLVSSPDINPNFSATSHKGSWIYTPSPSNCVFDAPYLPESLVQGKLFTFVISETMGDCIASILYDQDLLSGTLTQSMIPSNSPIQLNTSNANIKRIVPALYKLYPNTAMDIYAYAIESPDVIISSSKNTLEATIAGQLRVQVQRNRTSSYIPVFVLYLSLDVFADVNVSNNRIVANVNRITHNTSLVDSFIGPIDLNGVDELITVFIALGIEPLINKALANGFPIPDVSGIELTDSVLYYGDGYLRVGSDFTYSPEHLIKPLVDFLNDQPIN